MRWKWQYIKGKYELNRNSYGFEISKDFYRKAQELMLNDVNVQQTLIRGVN